LSGNPADLVVEEIDPPPLVPGSLRIAVRAAGLNFADTLLIAGKYQNKLDPPFVPGFELAGRVIDCAPDVTGFAPGDRVMAVVDRGAFAEEAVAPADSVFRLADPVSDVIAAGFPIAYGTSHLGLKFKAGLQAGEWLLVHGAAGGVGLTAVEVGKRLGARIIATASGPEKLRVAADAGAEHVIDSSAADLRERVKTLTGGRGVDLVYDPVGGRLFDISLRCTALGGRILIVGFASGEVPQIPANILLVKNISALGYFWGQHKTIAPEWMRASLEELLAWLEAGVLTPHVSQTFPLTDAAAALSALKARKTTGKVVLTVGHG
jgi:NADPH2:quinone reductase